MTHTLTVDGVNLKTTYGLQVSGYNTYNGPTRNFATFSVPNKNGLVLGRETHLNNINVSYHCCIAGSGFDTNIAGLRDFLLSKEGYVTIADTYHTDEFRKGLYMGPFEPKVLSTYDGAEFDLVFNCMPQRWLNSGQTAVTIGTSGYISNPTKQKAKPLIKVTGKDGYIYLGPNSGRYRIKILDTLDLTAYSSIYIDCETMEAYYDGDTSVNLNPYLVVRQKNSAGLYNDIDGFPVLVSGSNYCARQDATGTSYGITAAEIVPRWWRA